MFGRSEDSFYFPVYVSLLLEKIFGGGGGIVFIGCTNYSMLACIFALFVKNGVGAVEIAVCISSYHASRIMVCGEAGGDINVEPALKDHHHSRLSLLLEHDVQ